MPNPDREVWDAVRAHLKGQHPEVCRHWFEDLKPLGIAGGAFAIRASSVVHRDYLRRDCLDAFLDATREATGQLVGVRFLGPEDSWDAGNERHGDSAKSSNRPPRAKATPIRSEAPPSAAQSNDHSAPSANASNGTSNDSSNGVSNTPINNNGNGTAPHDHAARAHQAGAQANSTTEHKPAPRHQRVTHAPSRLASERIRSDRPDSLPINPDYEFDNFVVGPNNRLPHAAAIAVSQNPGQAYNPLFIHGGVGLGKTHLLQAVCMQIQNHRPETIIHYVSCDSFVTHFMDAVQSGEMSGFRHEFRDVDVLVIDDIHFLAGRERTQEEFFHTFNSLYQANKQIILSSDAAPEEIPDLEDRLISRFKWGLVAKIEAPSYETRVAILKTKAELRGLTLPDDAAEHIARVVTGNIRELEGAIVRIQMQSTVEDRPIDVALAREVVGDPAKQPTSGPTIDSIIQTVTDFYHVKRTDVLGKRRHKSVSLPRHVCMFLARAHTRHSLEEIGAHFGGRDHTTVMHAVRTIEARRTEDEDFAAVIRTLEDRLTKAAIA